MALVGGLERFLFGEASYETGPCVVQSGERSSPASGYDNQEIALMNALPRYAAFGDSDHIDFVGGCAVCAGGCDHSFADAELHFAWGQVGHADD